jgi:hypothetical protein
MFGAWARAKHWFGGGSQPPTITVSSGTTAVTIPETAGAVLFSGAATALATLNTGTATRGSRLLYLYSKNGDVVLYNSGAGATVGQMDLGSSDVTLAATGMIMLYLRSDGVWIRATPVANN